MTHDSQLLEDKITVIIERLFTHGMMFQAKEDLTIEYAKKAKADAIKQVLQVLSQVENI